MSTQAKALIAVVVGILLLLLLARSVGLAQVAVSIPPPIERSAHDGAE